MRKTILLLSSLCLLGFGMIGQVSAKSNGFIDVKEGQWYAQSVAWATENKIIVGFPDGTFRPDDHVTEEQFLTMLGRVNNLKKSPYEDAEERNMPLYYKLSLPLDRNEVAVYLAANLGLAHEKDIVSESISFLYKQKIARGTSSNGEVDIQHYQGTKLLTRAEAVTMIQRTVDTGLSLRATLNEQPKIKYPKSVIMNSNAPIQFTEVISNLPAISGLELRTGQYDHMFSAVDIFEEQYNGENSASFILHTTKNNLVTIFIRHESEAALTATREVLSLYIEQAEAEEVLEKYLELRAQSNSNDTFNYETNSEYTIKISKVEIAISL
ncbi:S-layer homology domain-containing protein [Paenibacillus sp. PL2-23]|uniref:S-layer homology domain-containing protein n=1 Tax=Paenibacillus sp. PL2-23 TaxID=2100729 RepID=UPI0030F699D6